MNRTDFPTFQKWLFEQHVDSWWHERLSLPQIEAKYGPRIDGVHPTYMYIILLQQTPIGWVQWYRWCDYPDHAAQLNADKNSAGIDLAIGEKEWLGQGLGSKIIGEFLKQFVLVFPDISSIVSDPEEKNLRSLRAFEKAGFDITRVVQVKGENVKRRIAVWTRQ